MTALRAVLLTALLALAPGRLLALYADFCAALKFPSTSVFAGSTFEIVAEVQNCPTGSIPFPANPAASNVTAVLALSTPDSASVWLVSGPLPLATIAQLAPYNTAFFTWTYQAVAGGILDVTLTVSGQQVAPLSGPISATLTGQMEIHDAKLSATLYLSPLMTGSGRPVIISARVGNYGLVRANNVVPLARTWSGCSIPSEIRLEYVSGGTVIAVSGPYPNCPVSLDPGEEMIFTWTATAAQAGKVNFTVDLTASGAGLPMSVVQTSATSEFTVKDLCAQLFLSPEHATVGQNVAAIGKVTVCGPEPETNVVPLSYTAVGCGLPADVSVNPPAGGNLYLLSGPQPACAVSILTSYSAFFTWNFSTTKTGQVYLTVSFTGLGIGPPYPQASATTRLEIQTPAQLSVTAWSEPAESVPYQQTVNVYLAVKNLGEASADIVTPLPQTITGTGSLTLLPCPSGAACPENEVGSSVAFLESEGTAVFTWVYRVDNPGYVVISSAASGNDFNNAQPVYSGTVLLPLLLPNPSLLSVTITGAATLVQGQEFTLRADVLNPMDIRICQAELAAGGFRALLNGSAEHVTVISVEPPIPRCYENCVDCAIGGELNCCRREFMVTVRLSRTAPLGMALLSLSLAGNDAEGVPIISSGLPLPVQICSSLPGISSITPNPFRLSRDGMARIGFVVSTEQGGKPVTLAVYTVAGELVRTLADGALAAGMHEAIWDGTNSEGKVIASGVYILLLQAQPGRDVAKLGVIK